MRFLSYGFFLVMLLFLFSCSEERDFIGGKPEIVVEGYIENGKVPVVTVTKTLTFSGESLKDMVVSWAKVVISSDTDSCVLTCRYNPAYLARFVYTTSDFYGEVGKEYKLRVECEGKVYTSKTTIPEPVKIDSFSIKPCVDSDTLYEAKAFFVDPDTEGDKYKISTQVVGKDNIWHSALLGCFDDGSFSGHSVGVPVYKGRTYYYKANEEDFIPFFKSYDIVYVRLARIDNDSYAFWKAYDNAVNLGGNLFFSMLENLPSNVDGAKGCWCGMGSTIYKINIKTKKYSQIK